MSRSLITGVVITLVILASLATIFYYNFIKVKDRAAIEAVPNDAAIIVETNGFTQTWSNVKASDFWLDLQHNEAIKKITDEINLMDSVISLNPEMAALTNDKKMTISFHRSGVGGLSVLAIAETGGGMSATDVAKWLGSELKANIRKRNFEKDEVFDVQTSGFSPISVTLAIKDRLLLVSTDGTLVEEGLRKLRYKIPADTRGLNQAVALAKAGAELNVYLNYPNLQKLAGLFTRAEQQYTLDFFKTFANWSVLDVTIEKSKFNIAGITFTDDSLFQFLDLFKTQEPVALDFDYLLPKNTCYALMFGMSDYTKFSTDLNEYLQANQKLQAYITFNDSLENRYEIDIAQQLAAMAGKKAAVFMTEPLTDQLSKYMAGAIQFANIKQTQDLLQQYVTAISKRGEGDSVSHYHNGMSINRIMLGNFLKLVYGNSFEHIVNPVYFVHQDIIYFANDVDVLKSIIDQIQSGNVLGADSSYLAFSKGSSRSGNVSVYASLPRCYQIPSAFANNEMLSAWNRYNADFKKAEHFCIQYAASGNKAFYTTVSLQYNPSFTEENKQLWEVKIDTTLASSPVVVYNSSLKQNCILAQDVLNQLYFVNNSGMILWKSRLSGKINSSIHEVDFYRNGSTQYLFSTNTQVMLIDENGKNMPGYPIRFPGKAAAPITLADLYGDSSLSIFVPLENSRIMGYHLSGKPMSGWNPKVSPEKIKEKLKLTHYASIPLLYAASEKKKLMVFSLSNEKYNLPKDISEQSTGFVWLNMVDTVNAYYYYIDSGAVVNKVKLVSNRVVDEITYLLGFKPKKVEYITNKSGEQLVVYSDSARCYVKNLDQPSKQELMLFYEDSTYSGAEIINTPRGQLLLSKNKGTIGLYQLSSELEETILPPTPYTAIGIGDLMMDGNKYLIYTDRLNNLIVYRLK